MKKTSYLSFGLGVLAAACTVAGQSQAATSYAEADVLSSTPIYRVIETSSPSRECWEEEVVREVRSQDRDRSATPGILGAVIGGAIGNSMGHHNTARNVGTVVGAILGGSIARDITRANRRNDSYTYTDVVERCRTVHTTHQEEKLVGYDVRYSYNGSVNTVRLPRDPGATVKVRVDVEPVL